MNYGHFLAIWWAHLLAAHCHTHTDTAAQSEATFYATCNQTLTLCFGYARLERTNSTSNCIRDRNCSIVASVRYDVQASRHLFQLAAFSATQMPLSASLSLSNPNQTESLATKCRMADKKVTITRHLQTTSQSGQLGPLSRSGLTQLPSSIMEGSPLGFSCQWHQDNVTEIGADSGLAIKQPVAFHLLTMAYYVGLELELADKDSNSNIRTLQYNWTSFVPIQLAYLWPDRPRPVTSSGYPMAVATPVWVHFVSIFVPTLFVAALCYLLMHMSEDPSRSRSKVNSVQLVGTGKCDLENNRLV